MRLRTVEAPTIAAAMQLMRRTMGDDAAIVATVETAAGVRLTAAVEMADVDLDGLLTQGAAAAIRAEIAGCLAYHRVPAALADMLAADLARLEPIDAGAALAGLLAERFGFDGLDSLPDRPLALIGPSGCGKTAMTAKLALRAKLKGIEPRVISTDSGRAGGLEQLEALLRPMGLVPERRDDLASCPDLDGRGSPALIDMQGINPFSGGELAALATSLRSTAIVEPVLLLPAGGDAEDASEIAGNFAAIGVRRLMVTKLDAARRLGGILGAARAGLVLAGCGFSPLIGRGLASLTPGGLARVLLQHGPRQGGPA